MVDNDCLVAKNGWLLWLMMVTTVSFQTLVNRWYVCVCVLSCLLMVHKSKLAVKNSGWSQGKSMAIIVSSDCLIVLKKFNLVGHRWWLTNLHDFTTTGMTSNKMATIRAAHISHHEVNELLSPVHHPAPPGPPGTPSHLKLMDFWGAPSTVPLTSNR